MVCVLVRPSAVVNLVTICGKKNASGRKMSYPQLFTTTTLQRRGRATF